MITVADVRRFAREFDERDESGNLTIPDDVIERAITMTYGDDALGIPPYIDINTYKGLEYYAALNCVAHLVFLWDISSEDFKASSRTVSDISIGFREIFNGTNTFERSKYGVELLNLGKTVGNIMAV